MRLIGFGIGTLIFGIMTWTLIGEIPTLKTIVSLLLSKYYFDSNNKCSGVK